LILCGQCGLAVEPGQNFCLDCGQAIGLGGQANTPASGVPDNRPAVSPLPSPVSTQIAASRSKKFMIAISSTLAIAVVSILITVVLTRGRASDSSVSPDPLPIKMAATASSTRVATAGLNYSPANLLDGDLSTAWVEGIGGPGTGEWLRVDFNREVELLRLRITPGYFKSYRSWTHNNRLAAATFYFSDGTSRTHEFTDRMEQESVELSSVRTRWVRMTIDRVYGGSEDSDDTPISELAFDLKR